MAIVGRDRGRLRCLAAAVLLTLGAAVPSPPSPPSPHVYRMFVGTDGKSHIEPLRLDARRIGLGIEVGSTNPRESAALMKTGPVNFYQAKNATVDLIADPPRSVVGHFHWALRRAMVAIVSGQWEFRTTDGGVRVLHPGDILRVEDTVPGIGHTQRVIGTDWGVEMAAFEKAPSS